MKGRAKGVCGANALSGAQNVNIDALSDVIALLDVDVAGCLLWLKPELRRYVSCLANK